MSFGEAFGDGVALGTRVTETLQLRNSGSAPLTFSASAAGSPLFSLETLPLAGGSVAPGAAGFVRVRFGPVDGGWAGPTSRFTATLSLTTNATNLPSVTVPMSAVGVQP